MICELGFKVGFVVLWGGDERMSADEFCALGRDGGIDLTIRLSIRDMVRWKIGIGYSQVYTNAG